MYRNHLQSNEWFCPFHHCPMSYRLSLISPVIFPLISYPLTACALSISPVILLTYPSPFTGFCLPFRPSFLQALLLFLSMLTPSHFRATFAVSKMLLVSWNTEGNILRSIFWFTGAKGIAMPNNVDPVKPSTTSPYCTAIIELTYTKVFLAPFRNFAE